MGLIKRKWRESTLLCSVSGLLLLTSAEKVILHFLYRKKH